MFLNFGEIEDTTFTSDVCVIGAGAAGFSCAVTFLRSGLNVLFLEGGEKTYNKKAAELQKAEVVGHFHSGIHQARERIVGGTTTKWGGQALPFMEEDFMVRPNVPLSGWPISHKHLSEFYVKAEDILGTDSSVSFDYSPWNDWKIEKPVLSNDKASLFVTKWCKIPNFSSLHLKKIERSLNVTLLSNANVVELLPDENKKNVKAVKIKSLDGKEGLVNAKYVIAAGGAIETVRLFLNSVQFGSKGLGNKNGMVGLYFQDHVAAIVGQVFPRSRTSFHDVFDPFYRKGFKYFPRIKINPSYARKRGILHASAQVVFRDEPNSMVNSLKSIAAAVSKRQVPNLKLLKDIRLEKIAEILNLIFRYKVKNRGSSAKSGPIWLEIHSEQEPVKESCITLSETSDRLGMRRVCLNWSISALTAKTIKETAKIMEREFKNANIGKVVLEPWIEDGDEVRSHRWLSDVYHQAGGLRMSDNENAGVVDVNCKVFGIDNLYVASSAVFPTSSFSNPTMTTIALSIRICETILRQFK